MIQYTQKHTSFIIWPNLWPVLGPYFNLLSQITSGMEQTSLIQYVFCDVLTISALFAYCVLMS